MSRPFLELREAAPDDAAQLVQLWSTAGRTGEAVHPHSIEDAQRALAQMAGNPDERLVVGMHEGRVVAALHMKRAPFTPIHTEQIVHTSYLLVCPEFRRHGYGRALLDAAAAWAEEKDVRHVSAITASGLRETNRFLARLGLGTVATVRVSTTAGLRKRLSPDRGLRPTPANRHLGEVLAARRSMKRRTLVEDTSQDV
jgi:GNAT superfamily N-acetyltransferase